MSQLIGFLSDAHGNGPAFEKGLALLRSQGARSIYFLGDAVGYLPSPTVVESIARLGDEIVCIQGNHEAMMLKGGVDPGRELVYQLEAVRRKLGPELVRMIASWPTSRVVRFGCTEMLLVHGSPENPTFGYVYPDTDLSPFKPAADVIFMGHTHHPFIREHDGKLYVNIGSCGLPRDDGRFGSVAVFDPKERKARVLRFDITSESQLALKQAPTAHSSVRQAFARQRQGIVGDLLC